MARPANFASETWEPVHPRMRAFTEHVNHGCVEAYGSDTYTAAADAQCQAAFGPCHPFFVVSGTGANIVGLGSVLPRFSAILCADTAHLVQEEAGAVQRLLGCPLTEVPSHAGKLFPQDLHPYLKRTDDPHYLSPGVLSITQPTELGTLYSVPELQALSKFCRRHDLRLHMDGARLPYAAAALNTSLRAITGDVGVDALSFGGTKIGCAQLEAVVLFSGHTQQVPTLRKQLLQEVAKMRYTAAECCALLDDSAWQALAQHANTQARRLAEGLRHIPQADIRFEVQTNAVFVSLPSAWEKPLGEMATFFPVDEHLPVRLASQSTHWRTYRLITHPATEPAEVDRLIACMQRLA